MQRNEITPEMLADVKPTQLMRMELQTLEQYAIATYTHASSITPAVAIRVRYAMVMAKLKREILHAEQSVYPGIADALRISFNAMEIKWYAMWPTTPTPTPTTPAMIVDCVPAVMSAMLSTPVTPTPTMHATLVAGVANRYALEVLMSTSYATMQDWVAGEKISNHPGTTWVVRTVGTSVEVGTSVVYVDGRGSVLTMHASMVDVAEMARYYAGGMAGDLGATLDTCHTAYDVASAVCNHLVATGCNPFDIDGEMLGVVMYTGDYHTPLNNADLGAYANMWYTSIETIDTCRGCGYTVDIADAVLIDDEVWCEYCYADMVRRGDDDATGDYYTVEMRTPVYIETTTTVDETGAVHITPAE